MNDTEIVADEKTGTVKYKGKTYDVSEIIGKTKEQKAIEEQKDVKIKQIKKQDATGEDIELFETGKIRMIIQEENDETLKAVIPNGFYYVTGAPSTGLVVSDVFGDDDDNSKGGNQFVWVPCRGTGTVSYEKTNEDTVDKKHGLASYWAKYDKQWDYNTYGDWTDYGGDLDSVNKYGGFYVARYEAGVPSNATFYANTNGAKYITEKDANVIENGYKPVSKKNNQAWNFVYQRTVKTLSENMYAGNENVKSQLIDSYAWDTIIEWMSKEVLEFGNNSTGYGNYINSGIKFLDSLYAIHQLNNKWIISSTYKKENNTAIGYTELATGVTAVKGSLAQNKIKNIYDMAGNMWEWTTEVGNHGTTQSLLTEEQSLLADYAVARGGSFFNQGNEYPVSCRGGDHSVSTFNQVDFGFRVVLYIK